MLRISSIVFDKSPKRHLRLLERALKLWGTKSRASEFMYGDHWNSRRNQIWQRVLTFWFAIGVLIRAEHKLLLHGQHISICRGEITVVKDNLRSAVLALLRRREVFLVAPLRSVAPQIETMVEMFHLRRDRPLSVFLSINSILVLSGWQNEQQVVLHIALTKDAHTALDKHCAGLKLAALLLESHEPSVPKFIDRRSLLDYDVLVQSRVAGATPAFSDLTDLSLSQILANALNVTIEIARKSRSAARETNAPVSIAPYEAACELYPELNAIYRPAVAKLRAWHAKGNEPGVLVHGDFWLANIVCDPASLRITGVIDWEFAHDNGVAGLDALHFGIMTFAFGRGRPAADYVGQLLTGQCDEPLLAKYIGQIEEAYNLNIEDVKCLSMLIYFGLVLKISNETAKRTQRALLKDLLPVISAWAVERI